MFTQLRRIVERLWPPFQPRRYLVAPRQNPNLFRRRLLRGIAREMVKTGLAVSSKPVQYSDTAL